MASRNSTRPGIANDHDDEHMAKALAYIEHMLLDYHDELEEDGHAEENEQLALKIQEFEAFLLGTEAIAATQEEQEQPQPEQDFRRCPQSCSQLNSVPKEIDHETS
ncbi:hypothetical protein GBA52_023331 [Prunus armeniaca]|nr:hypothetical protein GBA52_023331 [Prunus armeniaca]